MTTVPATVLTLAALAAAGVLPVVAAVGLRWMTVPLVPLGGAVIGALAAACYLVAGGSFMGWFAGLAVVAASLVAVRWSTRPAARPWSGTGPPGGTRHRAAGAIGAVAVVAACGWCLRALASPAVGFDARSIWLMRGGWFLESHHQLLTDMRAPSLVLYQTAYPPLVSSSTAVAWSIAGGHSLRVGVVVIALLNTCALAAAALALVECGRTAAVRLAGDGPLPVAPLAAGVVAAALLVPVAFGITGPFMTNGYADPIWSLAAVGAVALGLQLRSGPAGRGATVVLLLVVGTSKIEGTAIAVLLIALVAVRGIATLAPGERRRQGRRPIGLAVLELCAVMAWPVATRLVHARGATSTFAPASVWPGRVRPTLHALAPYLHGLVLAVPLAAIGGIFLSRVRRAAGPANDGWGWAGLVAGLAGVVAVLVTDSGAIGPLLNGSVHRLSEFPALAGWWIVAVWGVVAVGSPAFEQRRHAHTDVPPPPEVASAGKRHDVTVTR